jgi:hypothetical protein
MSLADHQVAPCKSELYHSDYDFAINPLVIAVSDPDVEYLTLAYIIDANGHDQSLRANLRAFLMVFESLELMTLKW